jgi:hypothetical protein
MGCQALTTGEETTTSFTRATSGLVGCNPWRNEPASAFQQSRGQLQKCRIEVVLLMSTSSAQLTVALVFPLFSTLSMAFITG